HDRHGEDCGGRRLVRGWRPRQACLAPSAPRGGRGGSPLSRRRGTASPAVRPGAAPRPGRHSHLDVHPPHAPTGAHRRQPDNGLMGRDMRLLWRDQPRVTLKVAVYLTDVESPDDGALEVVPRSHLDTASRYPTEEQSAGVPILGRAGTVAVFDARLWHRRRDNLGTRIRRAMFMAYSYRWLTSRDTPFETVPEWPGLPPIRRQLLGDKTVDPFYWASGELPLDPRSTGFREAA